MRKAARKQKKLDKLANASPSNPNESKKFDKNTAIVLPQLEDIEILTRYGQSNFDEGRIKVNVSDFPGLAYAIANADYLKKISFLDHFHLIEYISEALKFNTSVKILNFQSSVVTDEEHQYFQTTLPYVRDILQYSRLTTFCWTKSQTSLLPAEALTELIKGLKNNTSLTSLTLPALRYTPEIMQGLAEAISNHPQLVDVTFQAGHLAGEGVKYMGGVLLANRLHKLSFETPHSFSGPYLDPVFDTIKHNTSLTFLSFAQTCRYPSKRRYSTDPDCELLYNALSVNQTLMRLNLNGMKLGSDRVSKIFDALHHHTSLTELNFWDNNFIDSSIAPALSSFLQVNESLTELDLPYSNITPDALQLIGPALKKNRSITSLNFFMNPIGSEGCKYLAEGLMFNKSLIRLNLKDCKIQEQGCLYLSEAIKTNQCLLLLDISGTEIKSEGYKALIDGMKENDSLTDLTVSKDKSVPQELHKEIVDIQNRNKAYYRAVVVSLMTALIQIARSDIPMFPLEIWLRIFKHLVYGGIPGFNHIAETILMQSDVTDLKALCKMKIVRINGKSHLVSSSIS